MSVRVDTTGSRGNPSARQIIKKLIFVGFLAVCPILTQADQIATSASMSIMQSQLNNLNQQMTNMQQALVTLSQGLQGMQKQSRALQQQIAQYASTSAKQFKWVDASDHQIPTNAFVAAENEGKPLYVCQAAYVNSSSAYGGGGNSIMIPGVLTSTGCVITYNGQAYLEPEYAVLTSTVSGYWINGDQVKNNNQSNAPVCPLMFAGRALDNSLMAASPAQPQSGNQPKPMYNALAIVGGQDNSGNTYICRAEINGQYFIGKGSNNTCYIAAGAYEANWPVYEVLLTRQP